MSFHLEITFAGLCMLVDDPKGPNGRRLHVLLPQTGPNNHHAGGTAHPHFPVLLYNPGHLGGTAESTANAITIPLTNRKLNLAGLNTSDALPTDLELTKGNVFDLGDLTKQQVERSLLDDGDETTHPAGIISRITISAGKLIRRKKGAVWKVGGLKPGHMAISITWRIENIDDDALKLKLEPLNENGTPAEQTLRPISNIGDLVRIWIFHTPFEELPSKVPFNSKLPKGRKKGSRADHFGGYFDLVNLVPVFDDMGNDPNGDLPVEERAGQEVDMQAQGVSGEPARNVAGGDTSALASARDTGVGAAEATAALGEEMTCMVVAATAKPSR